MIWKIRWTRVRRRGFLNLNSWSDGDERRFRQMKFIWEACRMFKRRQRNMNYNLRNNVLRGVCRASSDSYIRNKYIQWLFYLSFWILRAMLECLIKPVRVYPFTEKRYLHISSISSWYWNLLNVLGFIFFIVALFNKNDILLTKKLLKKYFMYFLLSLIFYLTITVQRECSIIVYKYYIKL